jgi:hypothetical protein
MQYRGRAKHFSQVFRGGGLVVLEGTPPRASDGSPSEERNAGVLALILNGQFWESLTASERADLFLLVVSQRGYYHCTRFDGQITIVDPEVSAEQIVQLVEEGSLWAHGFRTQRVDGNRNKDGIFVGGATQYWGGRGSDKIARSYNKAAERGWDGSAARHEVQLRGQRASDRAIQMKGALMRQKDRGPLLQTAEQEMIKAMLGQDLDYRDTNRWAGKEKPKNWAQCAAPPGWWQRAVGEATDPFEYSKRPKADLDQAYEAFLDQYGRKFALKVLKDACNTDGDVEYGLLGAFLECVRRTKEGDAQVIAQELPEIHLGNLQELLADWVRIADKEAQGLPLPVDGPAFKKGSY